MNIGIFTLYGSTNYGGVLQYYALSQVLKKLGHNPELVQYEVREILPAMPKRIVSRITSYTFSEHIHSIPDLINKFLMKKTSFIDLRKDKFLDFNTNNVNISIPVKSEELPSFIEKYDILIVGSDQVWSDLNSAHLPLFFDGFDNFKGIKISYAACSPKLKVPFHNRKKIQKLLGEFHAISVRDSRTKKLLEGIGVKNTEIVADPTLLYDFSNIGNYNKIGSKYIFCYILGREPRDGHLEAINLIKKQHGNIKVISIAYPGIQIRDFSDIVIDDASPTEWIELIKNAECVYTDSFHAVIFSLKFHTSFLAYYNEVLRSSRLQDLCKTFSLDGRIIQFMSQASIYKSIDWNHIDAIKDKLYASSMEFLIKSLS